MVNTGYAFNSSEGTITGYDSGEGQWMVDLDRDGTGENSVGLKPQYLTMDMVTQFT